MLLLNAAIYKPDSCGHGREGVYYAGSGEIPWREFNEAVGQGLFLAGKLPTPEVSTMTQEEEDQYLPFVSTSLSPPHSLLLILTSRSSLWRVYLDPTSAYRLTVHTTLVGNQREPLTK